MVVTILGAVDFPNTIYLDLGLPLRIATFAAQVPAAMAGKEEVLAVFQRFDVDNSGAISREELGEVLKTLDDSWSDESIDQMLAQADASGDGQLQLSEFMSWIFAEDPKTLGLTAAVGDFTVLISGTSREILHGEYVQEKGKLCGRRPVFYCAANKKFLYYNAKKGQWQVFHKAGSSRASCILKTQRAPHMPGDAVWSVWNVAEKKFIAETSASCDLLMATPEEQLAKAADILRPRVGESYGTFRNRKLVHNGRPVYHDPKTSSWMVYVEKSQPSGEEVQKWKVMKLSEEDLERSRKEDVFQLKDAIGWSEQTLGYSPEKATWRDPKEGFLFEWEIVDPTPVSADGGWIDPDFAHEPWAIGGAEAGEEDGSLDKVWVRAIHLSKDLELFGDEEPADALQGNVGNCGMIAVFAALAEYPGYLRTLFETKEISPEGKYKIRLFNMKKQDWDVMEVDDYLPCKPPTEEGVLTTAKPVFAKLNNGKIYMALLEKCFAKLLGSYKALDSFNSWWAYQSLTGCTDKFTFTDMDSITPLRSPEWKVIADSIEVKDSYGSSTSVGHLMQGATFKEVERKRYHVKFEKVDGEGPEAGWLPYFQKGKRLATRSSKRWWMEYSTEAEEMKDMFGKLVELDRSNYPIDTGPFQRTNLSFDGLLFPHAYTVLHAVKVQGFKMVCIRNPWGMHEWKGPWCDQGEEWKIHSSLAEALQRDFSNDGGFWMEWEDVEWNMGGFTGVRFEMPSQRGGFNFEEIEDDDLGESTSTQTSGYAGKLLRCSGLGVEWNSPVPVVEEMPAYPGQKPYNLEYVPDMLLGGSYIGCKVWPSAGTWTIEYEAPVKLYVWVSTMASGGVEDQLNADQWQKETVPRFQLGRGGSKVAKGGQKLNVWSREFLEGSSYSITTDDLIMGGVISN